MAEKTCKLSGTFEVTKSLGARFVPGGLVSYTDIYGNEKEEAVSATFIFQKAFIGVFRDSISKNSVFSSEVSLSGDFSCKEIDESSSEETDCGKLDFSQTCSSAHIVTIGL